MEEENKEEQENNLNGEDIKALKTQWLYRSILVVVLIGCIIGVASSAITYYVLIKNKSDKFLISTSNAKETDEDGNEVKKIVKASETLGDISNLLDTFAEFIDTNYIGEIDKNELVDSTLKGFIDGIGDEYSEYMTAEEWEEYQADALGNYVGVGIYMRADSETNYIMVDSTIKDTPAEKAGIKSGDLIVGVNGETTYGLSTAEVSNKVKGEEGTEVTLNILREEDDDYIDFKVQRQAIKVYHEISEMKEYGIVYIYVYTNDEGISDEN